MKGVWWRMTKMYIFCVLFFLHDTLSFASSTQTTFINVALINFDHFCVCITYVFAEEGSRVGVNNRNLRYKTAFASSWELICGWTLIINKTCVQFFFNLLCQVKYIIWCFFVKMKVKHDKRILISSYHIQV